MTVEKQNNICVLPVYRKDQWQALLGDGAKELEDTWEEWNVFSAEMIAGLEGRGIPYVRIPLDLEEIKQFCEEEGIPNDGEARSRLLYRRYNTEISPSKGRFQLQRLLHRKRIRSLRRPVLPERSWLS